MASMMSGVAVSSLLVFFSFWIDFFVDSVPRSSFTTVEPKYCKPNINNLKTRAVREFSSRVTIHWHSRESYVTDKGKQPFWRKCSKRLKSNFLPNYPIGESMQLKNFFLFRYRFSVAVAGWCSGGNPSGTMFLDYGRVPRSKISLPSESPLFPGHSARFRIRFNNTIIRSTEQYSLGGHTKGKASWKCS